jgi:hypothetical protein
MFVISIKTKLLAHYVQELSLFTFELKHTFFSSRCVSVIINSLPKFTTTQELETCRIAKFLWAPVAMQELKGPKVTNVQDFFSGAVKIALQ